jgi:hypothetical protein
MKQPLLIILLALIVGFSKAQTFSFSPDQTIESTNDVNDWLSDYIYIHNTSGSSLNLSFQTISNTMDPNGWNVLLCTSNGCYSYIPSGGSLGMVANGDSAHLNLHCGFVGIPGTGVVKVRVYETGNPSNSDTITFLYHAVVGAGIRDNTNDIFLSQNFPNPFTTSTTIKFRLDEQNGKLVITDIQGKKISEYYLNNNSGEIILTEKLKPGVYFYSLYCNEKLITNNKMIVQ